MSSDDGNDGNGGNGGNGGTMSSDDGNDGNDGVMRSDVDSPVGSEHLARNALSVRTMQSATFPQIDGAIVREMSWRDLPQVIGIEDDSFPEDAWSPAQFWSELAQAGNHKHYAVIVEDEDVLAYAGVQLLTPEAEILTIAVHPQVRGKGYGRTLVTYLEDTAAVNGCTTMHLEVATDNNPAHALYLALGYTDIGVRANYYGTGRDAFMMSKQLQVGA